MIAVDAAWDPQLGGAVFPDSVADKYLAKAAWDGTGAYSPFDELVSRYGHDVPAEIYGSPVARTPGAILLASALIPFSDEAIIEALKVVSIGCLLIVSWATARIAGLPAWVGGLVAVGLAGSDLMMLQFVNGNLGIVVAALVAVALWQPNRIGGVALGVAAVLKVWPAVLLVPMLMFKRSRRSGWWALGTVSALCLAGLMIPTVSLAGTIRSMFAGAGYSVLPRNLSASAILDVPLIVGGVVGLVVLTLGMLSDHPGRRLGAATIGGLLASPVTWPVYWLAGLPAVAAAIRRPDADGSGGPVVGRDVFQGRDLDAGTTP